MNRRFPYKPRLPVRGIKRLSPFALSLFAILLAVSCAPAVSTQSDSPTEAVLPAETPVTDSLALTEASPISTEELTEAPAVLPVATSRGDGLEATDPATVSFASGQLQLVEFFRFT